jgi:putative aldouronate transport system substrate-binding protein
MRKKLPEFVLFRYIVVYYETRQIRSAVFFLHIVCSGGKMKMISKKTCFLLCFCGCVFAALYAADAPLPAVYSKAVPVKVWYGTSLTKAAIPPADWNVYKILRDKVGVDLKLTPLPSSESEAARKINNAAVSNDLPDLFMVSFETLENLVKNGKVAPVDDMFAYMSYRTTVMYGPKTRSLAMYDGHSYGLVQSGSIVKDEGILIRRDWLTNLGLSVPVTTEDFANVMEAFTKNDPDRNGVDDTWGYGAFVNQSLAEDGLGTSFDPFFGAFGVAGTFNMTKAYAGLNVYKKGFYDALVYIRSLAEKKIIDPNWPLYGQDEFRAAWKQGRFGIMRENFAAYGSVAGYESFDKNFPDGSWIVIDPPKGPLGSCSVGSYSENYTIYAVSAKAGQNAEKHEAIIRLFKWMSSSEGYYLLGYGEKDVNYHVGKDGVITDTLIPDPKKAFTRPDQVPFVQLGNMIFLNTDAELLSRYPAWSTVKGKQICAYSVLLDMQSRPWTAALGADRLPPPSADVKRFYEQSLVEFVTGARSLTPESWSAWLGEFNKIGGKKWNDDCVAYMKSHFMLTD